MGTGKIELGASATVSDAIDTRISVRAFLDTPVPEALLREMVEKASRAASGGNLQPWKLYVLSGGALRRLVDAVAEKRKTKPIDGMEYAIYPPELTEPYVTRRGDVGKQMYELVGIARDDQAGRDAQMGKNFEFFGAPVGMILCIEKQMGPPQWCDLGIFLDNLMLLAREAGLHSCPQEAWSLWAPTVREVVGVPEDEVVFCGLSLGYADPDDPVNRMRTDRAPLQDWATFLAD